MASADLNEDEELAEAIATDAVGDTLAILKLMMVHGPNPSPDKRQAIFLREIADVRHELLAGELRPWFTHQLTKEEQLAEWMDGTLRVSNIHNLAQADPQAAADYMDKMNATKPPGGAA